MKFTVSMLEQPRAESYRAGADWIAGKVGYTAEVDEAPELRPGGESS